MIKDRIFYVYELYVEGEINPFYVGKTFKGSKRFQTHLSPKRNVRSYKTYKILVALSEGKTIVERVVFETLNEQDAFAEERRLIAFYGRVDKKTGILCNHTDGGEGTTGIVRSKEYRAKVIAANKRTKSGKPVPKAVLDAAAKANRGSKQTKERVAHRNSFLYKSVDMFSKEDKFIRSFTSSKEASQMTGIKRSSICQCLKGKYKLVGKEKVYFKYKVEN